MSPHAVLLDYGGTLVEEVAVDLHAGNAWLLAQASYRPPNLTLESVVERARRLGQEVVRRREETLLEIAWPALARLIHDYFGTRFDRPWSELELGFWQASVSTKAMPGAQMALAELSRLGIPVGVVSNTSFSTAAISYELGKHGLADYLAFVMVSSEYAIRKPNVLLFETAAARLGVAAVDIWFMGDRLDTDVTGAKAAGMTAVWLNTNQRPDPAQLADRSVTGWHEFLQQLLQARPS